MRSFWYPLGDRIRHVGHILHAKFADLDVPESGEAIVIREAASPD
jgi:hypothetical protein